MRYLHLADLRAVAEVVLDAPMEVRDWGLLESALARPATTVFGADAYPSVWDKAAALLHSLARNHALVDGNKRVAFTACVLFLRKNGIDVAFAENDAYDLVIGVAEGRLDVTKIAVALESWLADPRPDSG